MRLNQFIAASSNLSRRTADAAIVAGRVKVNNQPAKLGQSIEASDEVLLDDKLLKVKPLRYIALNKPVGYVCSRDGQGAPTVYELLPPEHQDLQTIGRLDKDSSGLIILTNDGELAHSLGHPSSGKAKRYLVTLANPLTPANLKQLADGVELPDGMSHLEVSGEGLEYEVVMVEGRNRQVRRTFDTLGNEVMKLERLAFGPVELGDLASGTWRELKREELA